MPVTRTLRCPDCNGTFPWLFLAKDESDLPDHCAKCGNNMTEPDQEIGGPHIRTEKALAGDRAFRQYSDATIEQAAAQGNPNLKVTNMKDNLREGDVAAMAPQPSPEYKQLTEAIGASVPGGLNPWQANVQGTIAQVQTGRVRTTGATALRAIQGGAPPVTQAIGNVKGSWGGA